MLILWTFLSALLVTRSAATPARRSYDTHNYYVLHHDPTTHLGASLADVVDALQVELVEQAGELRDYWIVRQSKLEAHIHARDGADPVLSTFDTLKAQAAGQDTPLHARSGGTTLARRIVSSVDYISAQTLRQRSKRAPPPIPPPVEPAKDTLTAKAVERYSIQDPTFPQQWHLVNDEFPEHMMNVTGIWDMGYTGKGIISSLVDDGLDYESDDLAANFDADDSYDFNDHQALPTPKNWDDHHGTRCAGQIAAVKNNVCGLGIAYESKVAGVRILSGPITDVDEAAALNYGFQNVSVYSCSWGPPDNGQAMEGPNYLIQKAVVNGINNGRGGKGSIFVFASGNGAAHGDQCNFDGYTNSIYSVTVSAVDHKGLHPYYSEPCAANMIVAYSSGSSKNIVTTDKGKNVCATTHGGTSAAAPNAAGVFVLALQARPDLTWRDVQHLSVENARMINQDDPDWEITASGRKYSYKYGYGVLDGFNYVKAAKSWKLVKPQSWIQTSTIQLNNGTFGQDKQYKGGEFIKSGGLQSTMTITKEMLEDNNFEALEHVSVRVWIQHTTRGDVEVEIVSPNGIRSVLGGVRPNDKDGSGYPGWVFMSVKHWGESPIGNWTLKVKDQQKADSNGTFLGWNMIFWGSTIDPDFARNWEVPLIDDVLPPIEAPPRPVIHPSATTSVKQHPKPTALLPSDHAQATGEASKPAFTSAVNDVVQPSPTSTNPAAITSTPDFGWFSDMSSLVTGQKWFFGVLGVVALFGIGAGIFFWRRRMAQRAGNYTSLGGDNEMTVTGMRSAASGPRTTRELYDAFGEVSDDDDNDDETTALHPPNTRSAGAGIGFHSGFLDDDEPSTAAGLTPAKYRDAPEHELSGRHSLTSERESPSPLNQARTSSSSPASWEHASPPLRD